VRRHELIALIGAAADQDRIRDQPETAKALAMEIPDKPLLPADDVIE
jgi:hypothetical protein